MAVPAVLGLLGALIGSFLNVVVYRVPLGRSIVRPPSACGSCGHPVRGYDNIPVLSWLVLRGRCRDCRAAISVRYPLVELGGVVMFAVVGLRFGPELLSAGGPAALAAAVVRLVAFLYLGAISIALALIDLDTRRLPNAIVLPAYPVGAVLLTVATALTGAWPALITAGAGLAIAGGLYLIVALVRPGGLGMGDVKLAGVLGLFLGWLGWPTLAVGVIGGFLVGGVVGIGLLLAGRGRRAAVAFGPWMLAGAWIGVLGGDRIASGYLALFGLT